jgi:nucleoside-diphosphate-sugar epimerase
MRLRGTKVTITGAGGFIGRHAARRAAQAGMIVRGVELTADAVRRCEAEGIPCMRGDVTDPASLLEPFHDADVVVHAAAHVAEGGLRQTFERINVFGTETALAVAKKQGVKRFVHLSSVMVYGFHHGDDIDEETPLRSDGNPYNESKIASERLVLAAHERGDLEAVILRPGDVWGPGSVPWVERPLAMMRKGLFVLPDGGRTPFNHLHIENLCDAMGLALERDVVGLPVHLTDGLRTTVREYFLRLGALVGRRHFPTVPAKVFAKSLAVLERGADLLGIEPPLRASVLPFLLRPGWMDIGRARRTLGYRARVSLDFGMEELDRALHPRELGVGARS